MGLVNQHAHLFAKLMHSGSHTSAGTAQYASLAVHERLLIAM
jgi:hypothetical protein